MYSHSQPSPHSPRSRDRPLCPPRPPLAPVRVSYLSAIITSANLFPLPSVISVASSSSRLPAPRNMLSTIRSRYNTRYHTDNRYHTRNRNPTATEIETRYAVYVSAVDVTGGDIQPNLHICRNGHSPFGLCPTGSPYSRRPGPRDMLSTIRSRGHNRNLDRNLDPVVVMAWLLVINAICRSDGEEVVGVGDRGEKWVWGFVDVEFNS